MSSDLSSADNSGREHVRAVLWGLVVAVRGRPAAVLETTALPWCLQADVPCERAH
jgi:hypothetical protein